MYAVTMTIFTRCCVYIDKYNLGYIKLINLKTTKIMCGTYKTKYIHLIYGISREQKQVHYSMFLKFRT